MHINSIVATSLSIKKVVAQNAKTSRFKRKIASLRKIVLTHAKNLHAKPLTRFLPTLCYNQNPITTKREAMKLTHLDEKDRPKMVDVSDKNATTRVAVASGIIEMSRDAYEAIVTEKTKKGPVLQTAVIAAIMGTKKTSELIPMCHPLNLSGINCDVEELPELPGFKLTLTAKLTGQTGVEMEALTGVSIGLLTIYDMVKAIDKGMVIRNVQLETKSGGKSGDYQR